VPVWWAWVGFTFYADRFDTDDLAFRLLMFAEMLGVAALATATPDALHGGSAGYAIAFVSIRVVLIVLYLRAHRSVPDARGLTGLYTAAFSVAAALWLVSLLVPTPGRYAVWGVAVVLDVCTPLFARRVIQAAPISPSHIPERIGLFTIIVLGESVIAVVVGTADTDWNSDALVAAIGGFAIACAIWWIYFDTLDTSLFKRGLLAGQIYLYTHLPLLAGLTAAGAGIEIAIHDAAHGKLSDGARWAVCGGIAVALVCMAVINFTATQAAKERDLWIRLTAAAGTLAVAFAGVSVFVTIPVVVGILALLVASELGHADHVHDFEGV
jgi:low temperature requirement protein LtrA